ncbi:hypothetical protein ADUPG1_010977 [Aduncisulcus paluster]|uniref:Uncharacterized protein n=1 Tax=Aduncisulcus paluster TaxID=2918883 RepID=A0ABQ5JY46_9EUKA|nr:hypothetical protein ADUPG1_010977 [Aduncisulcus paluster]
MDPEAAKFVQEGNFFCCPIPRDSPDIKKVNFDSIEAKKGTCDRIADAKNILLGGSLYTKQFTYISIPFTSSSPIKGALICVGGGSTSPRSPQYLEFTFTSEGYHWCSLPLDLPNVNRCEIKGRGREHPEEECFMIKSLVFTSRSVEEIMAADLAASDRIWASARPVIAEFLMEAERVRWDFVTDHPSFLKHKHEPRDLCEIEGKGTWRDGEKRRNFSIASLIFIKK